MFLNSSLISDSLKFDIWLVSFDITNMYMIVTTRNSTHVTSGVVQKAVFPSTAIAVNSKIAKMRSRSVIIT